MYLDVNKYSNMVEHINWVFIRAVSWSAQYAESHWSHVHIILTEEHFSFHAFYVWVTARFDVLFKSLNVTKTINIFFTHFRFFEKATNLFNATGHHACSPTTAKISIDILLPTAKSFGLKLA